jgi:biopolymer transport protein TolR
MAMRSGRVFNDINVTPLVDVMLVLLVVFMITAPLLTASLPVELPSVEGTPADTREKEVVVTVEVDGTIWVDKVDASDDVAAAVRTAVENGAVVAVVRADRRAMYESVARAVAGVRDGGAPRVELIVDPQTRIDE